ncbi:Hypoxanthine phosphoribosyltransferase [Buchnera aphidicola (Neophyllaphis podocarpi)]|uniref:hypoxanthine phosphoribosyltransferase n=1 Tax=Buchnera aphidicola TaxID=9 RepID=UPI0031B84900
MNHTVEMIISKKELQNRIKELGKQITNNYKNSNSKMVLVGLLKGSFMFMADLCRAIDIDHSVDFITTSSYGKGMISNHNVKILKDLEEDIFDKDVIIVEDIIDSGNTLNKIVSILHLRKPKSLAICTLLNKPGYRDLNFSIDYIGFSITNDFMVGYGIDYAQCYRHLPYIGKVVLFK